MRTRSRLCACSGATRHKQSGTRGQGPGESLFAVSLSPNPSEAVAPRHPMKNTPLSPFPTFSSGAHSRSEVYGGRASALFFFLAFFFTATVGGCECDPEANSKTIDSALHSECDPGPRGQGHSDYTRPIPKLSTARCTQAKRTHTHSNCHERVE